MPIEYVNQRTNRLSDGTDREELRRLFEAVVDAVNALTAKLDADAGVTDTNYQAVFKTFLQK